MSTNGDKAKAKRRGPKLSPLFMLGSDGYLYGCCPANTPHAEFIKKHDAILAIRLTPRERDLVLDTIQTEGVIEAAKTLAGILRPHA